MNTTQGTAGLIDPVLAFAFEQAVSFLRLEKRPEQHDAYCEAANRIEAAFLSAKPAPVEAQGPTEIVLFDKTLKRFLGGGNVWGDGRPITDEARYWLRQGWDMAVSEDVRRLPKREPAPELAVADEGRFEELLESLIHEAAAAAGGYHAQVRYIAEKVLAWAFKQSRSPVQEGAIDDETRDALEIAIVCIQQLERMSREIDSTPATIKGEPIMRHIAALERLLAGN